MDGLKKNIEEEVDKIIKSSNHVSSSSEYGSRFSPQEFGGWPGAFFLIYFVPVFVVALQFSCISKVSKAFLIFFFIILMLIIFF